MLSLNDYLKGRDLKFPQEYTEEVAKNSIVTIALASQLLSHFGEDRKCTSGWRPQSINKNVGGSPLSQHLWGNAIDLEDHDGRLKAYCVDNPNLLAELGIWCEAPEFTPTWLHMQRIPPHSGNRFFRPRT